VRISKLTAIKCYVKLYITLGKETYQFLKMHCALHTHRAYCTDMKSHII